MGDVHDGAWYSRFTESATVNRLAVVKGPEPWTRALMGGVFSPGKKRHDMQV